MFWSNFEKCVEKESKTCFYKSKKEELENKSVGGLCFIGNLTLKILFVQSPILKPE